MDIYIDINTYVVSTNWFQMYRNPPCQQLRYPRRNSQHLLLTTPNRSKICVQYHLVYVTIVFSVDLLTRKFLTLLYDNVYFRSIRFSDILLVLWTYDMKLYILFRKLYF